MSKFIENINSDTITKSALSELKFATTVGAWCLIFYFLVPILIAFAKNLFGITTQGGSTVSIVINTFLYYILSPVIATIVVKWQNQKLAVKSLKFRKVYSLTVAMVLSMFTLVNIIFYFIAKR